MGDGNDVDELSASRKNSILVKEEHGARPLVSQVHPHFVEQVLPHRSPPAGPVMKPAPKKPVEPLFEGFDAAFRQPEDSVRSSRSDVRAPEDEPRAKPAGDPRIPLDDGKLHILLGVTGSLHASSVKSIVAKLKSIYGDRVAIQVVLTPAAEKMVAAALQGREANPHKEFLATTRVWHDADEWATWRGRNDPVIHIELRRWADILVIAPLSANTLGKIAMGLCDNLLTNVVRAWNNQYPMLIAPAMVSYAYNHPATKHHLSVIREEMKWIEVLKPTEKVAGSTGGIGMGGMMPWNEIVDKIVNKLGGYPDDEDDEDDEKGDNGDEEDEDDDDDKPAGADDNDEDEDEDEDDNDD